MWTNIKILSAPSYSFMMSWSVIISNFRAVKFHLFFTNSVLAAIKHMSNSNSTFSEIVGSPFTLTNLLHTLSHFKHIFIRSYKNIAFGLKKNAWSISQKQILTALWQIFSITMKLPLRCCQKSNYDEDL